MEEFQIEIYETSNGHSQLHDFIIDMDPKTKAKFIAYSRMLKEKGPILREPYSKHLDGNIFELRIDVFSKFTRILYFFVKDKKIIMTNAFIKKTNKTPRSEIEKAIKYRNDYLERTKYD